jgi:GAF domain-containing protein
MKNKIELTSEIKYQLLRDISHKIRGTLDLDKILNLLLDLLANIIDYDSAGIFILSEDINHPGYHQTKQKIASMVQRGFGNLPLESDAMQIPAQSYSILEKYLNISFEQLLSQNTFYSIRRGKGRFLWFDKFDVLYSYGDY